EGEAARSSRCDSFRARLLGRCLAECVTPSESVSNHPASSGGVGGHGRDVRLRERGRRTNFAGYALARFSDACVPSRALARRRPRSSRRRPAREAERFMSTAEPQNSSHHDPSSRTKVTVPSIRHAKGQRSLVMVTAYDAAFARILDDAGVDILLVGDSLGMVVQGEATTLGVTVEQMIYHARAVARGTRFAHIVVDMPFLSYQVNVDEAVRNAGRMLNEGQAHAVKLEGGQPMVPTIERMVGVGIPVMGHLGLTPQSVHAMGGFKVQGREARDAERIVADARALEAAGVYAL